MAAKKPITGVKYVEYIEEDRNDAGTWGVKPTNPVLQWLGLVNEFIPPHKELYEESRYTGDSAETHTLELNRNTNVGTELNASLKYAMQDWNFIKYIAGDTAGLSDTVDSISVVAYLDNVTPDKWTVLTGGMLTKWALTIPESGIATVDADIMFGDVDSLTETDPKQSGSHASELSTAPFTWKGVTELYMDATDTPSTSFLDIVGDIGITITNEVEMPKGVDSTYATKGIGVVVNKRTLEVSLDLTYTSPNIATFQGYVTGHSKLNLSFKLGSRKIVIKGLRFPEWVAELKPSELVGQTVTAITDLPYLFISNWTEVKDTTDTQIYSLAEFDSYIYAGTGAGGKIYRSTDGTTWTEAEDTAETQIHALAEFSSYLYAGTGELGKIYRSSNGTTWTEAEDTVETHIYALAVFGSYIYAGTGDNGKIYRSNDGTTWAEVKDTAQTAVRSLAVLGSYIYAGTSANGKIYRSTDGTTWAEVLDVTDSHVYSLAVLGSYIYAGTGDNGKIYRSTNGTTWTEVLDTAETSVRSLAVFDSKIYAGTSAHGKIFRSSNGTDWIEVEDLAELHIYSLGVLGSYLYAGTGDGGKIYRTVSI